MAITGTVGQGFYYKMGDFTVLKGDKVTFTEQMCHHFPNRMLEVTPISHVMTYQVLP